MFKLNILTEKPTVGVITPTISFKNAQKAINSVQFQSYDNTKIKHYVVVDGQEYVSDFYEQKQKAPVKFNYDNVMYYNLTENTGKNHYGHRIYAAFPHLMDCDIIMLLDDDNQYESFHIETMVETMLNNGNDWCHSLRSIWDSEGNFVCDDNCESLGVYPVFNNENDNLVDTSSYGFKKDFLIHISPLWHKGYGADRIFYDTLVKKVGHTNFSCTGNYSLKYFLHDSPTSVKKEFFLAGNEIMEKKYNGHYPWLRETKHQ